MGKGNEKIRSKGRDKKKLQMDRLHRELEYTRITYLRAEKEWRSLCSQITQERLKEQVIWSWNSFERTIDLKDFIISIYMDALRDHEDIQMNNFRNHEDKISEILECFAEMLHNTYEKNNEQLQEMIRTSYEDWNKQATETEKSDTYLKIMSHGLLLQYKSDDKQIKTENFARINEESTKFLQEIQDLTFHLELKYEDLWDRIVKCESDFVRSNLESKKRHDAIKEVEDANNATIRKELKKLVQLQEDSKSLSYKYKDLVSSLGDKLQYLQMEKETLHEILFGFRDKLAQDKDGDTVKRTLMTVEFVKTFEYLNEKMKRGEVLIRVLNVTRNYETEREKLLPYTVGDKLEYRSSLPELTLFMQRMAGVQASRYALNEERMFLRRENDKLKKEIHKFCECLDCPALPPIPKRFGKVPYTEGTEMIRRINIQNGCSDKSSKSENNESKIEDSCNAKENNSGGKNRNGIYFRNHK